MFPQRRYSEISRENGSSALSDSGCGALPGTPDGTLQAFGKGNLIDIYAFNFFL